MMISKNSSDQSIFLNMTYEVFCYKKNNEIKENHGVFKKNTNTEVFSLN